MTMREPPLHDQSTVKSSLLRWVLWMVTIAGLVGDALLFMAITSGLLNQWAMLATEAENAKDRNDPTRDLTRPGNVAYGWTAVMYLVVGVIAIIFVVYNEVVLRRGEMKGELLKKFAKVMAWELGIAVVMIIARALINL